MFSVTSRMICRASELQPYRSGWLIKVIKIKNNKDARLLTEDSPGKDHQQYQENFKETSLFMFKCSSAWNWNRWKEHNLQHDLQKKGKKKKKSYNLMYCWPAINFNFKLFSITDILFSLFFLFMQMFLPVPVAQFPQVSAWRDWSVLKWRHRQTSRCSLSFAHMSKNTLWFSFFFHDSPTPPLFFLSSFFIFLFVYLCTDYKSLEEDAYRSQKKEKKTLWFLFFFHFFLFFLLLLFFSSFFLFLHCLSQQEEKCL